MAKQVPHESVDLYRKDLAFQLSTPDDLDWDYFIETAYKARELATAESINMAENDSPVSQVAVRNFTIVSGDCAEAVAKMAVDNVAHLFHTSPEAFSVDYPRDTSRQFTIRLIVEKHEPAAT